MVRRTGLAPWEVKFPFPGSLTSTFLPLQVELGEPRGRDAGLEHWLPRRHGQLLALVRPALSRVE